MKKKKIYLSDRKKKFYFLISDIVDKKFFRRYELNLITSKEVKSLKKDCFIFIIINDFDDVITLIDLVFFTKNIFIIVTDEYVYARMNVLNSFKIVYINSKNNNLISEINLFLNPII